MLKLSEKNINYLKLFLTGIILIWLFVRSPFNPIYSDSTPGEWAFVKLNFIYWILVSVFLIWIIYFVNKKNFDKYSLFIFTSANFLYISFYIFYGLDVIDSGFHLSKQWSMYNGLWEDNFDAIAGTNLIGGLWLKLYGEPMLIWARLGFVIVQTSIPFIAYKTMLLYFNPKRIFKVMLPLSLFLSTWYLYFTINYDNLPFLFFSLSVYFLLKGLMSESTMKNLFIYSGIFSATAVFCKITYAPAVILLLILIYLDHTVSMKKHPGAKGLYLMYGLIIGLVVITLFLLISSGLDDYVTKFINMFQKFLSPDKEVTKIKDSHTYSGLYSLYKNNIFVAFSFIFRFAFLIFVSEYIITKAKNMRMFKILLILICSVFIYYSIFRINHLNQFISFNFISLLSFFLTINILWIFGSDKLMVKKYAVLLAASLFMFVFSFAGSDLGFRAAYHTGSPLLLFSIPVILIEESTLRIFGKKMKFNFLFYFIITVFSLNIIHKKDNFYRETSFSKLTTPFESHQLAGIKSNPLRVDAIDSLISFLSSVPDLKEKNILFTHSNPMMYFLNDINYFLISPWDITNNLNYVKNYLSESNPEMIVIPALSHRDKYWPLKDDIEDPRELGAKRYYDLYDKHIEKNNYSIIFSNFFYTVYGLTKEAF